MVTIQRLSANYDVVVFVIHYCDFFMCVFILNGAERRKSETALVTSNPISRERGLDDDEPNSKYY